MRVLSLYDPEEIENDALYRNHKLNERNAKYANMLDQLVEAGATIHLFSVVDWAKLAEQQYNINNIEKVVRSFMDYIVKPASRADVVTYQTDNLFRVLCDVFDCHQHRDMEYWDRDLSLEEVRKSEKKAKEFEHAVSTRVVNAPIIGYFNHCLDLDDVVITEISSDVKLPAESDQIGLVDQSTTDDDTFYELRNPYTAYVKAPLREVLALHPFGEGIGDLKPWWELYQVFRLAARIIGGIEGLLEKCAWKHEEKNITMFSTQFPYGELRSKHRELYPML